MSSAPNLVTNNARQLHSDGHPVRHAPCT